MRYVLFYTMNAVYLTILFLLKNQPSPRSTLAATRFPYTALFRTFARAAGSADGDDFARLHRDVDFCKDRPFLALIETGHMLDRDMAFRRRQAGEGDVRVPRGQQVVERRIARPRVGDAAPRAQQLVERRQRPADEDGGGEDSDGRKRAGVGKRE